VGLGNSRLPKVAPPGLGKRAPPPEIDINDFSREGNMSEKIHRVYLDKQNFVLRKLTYHTYDFSEEELKQIVRYGEWFQALMEGKAPADNPARRHFVSVCKGHDVPTTEYEKLWSRYLFIVAKDDERFSQDMRESYANERNYWQNDVIKKPAGSNVKDSRIEPIYHNWKTCRICDGDGLNGRCWNCDGSGLIKW
jgi:uncharacterized protein YifE (UPF0438 family)